MKYYKCKNCGIDAKSKHTSALFCSRTCKTNYKSPVRRGQVGTALFVEVICANCGNSKMSNKPNTKFCSRQCKGLYNKEGKPRVKGSVKEYSCKACGNGFERIETSRYKLFCSELCRSRFRSFKKNGYAKHIYVNSDYKRTTTGKGEIWEYIVCRALGWTRHNETKNDNSIAGDATDGNGITYDIKVANAQVRSGNNICHTRKTRNVNVADKYLLIGLGTDGGVMKVLEFSSQEVPDSQSNVASGTRSKWNRFKNEIYQDQITNEYGKIRKEMELMT